MLEKQFAEFLTTQMHAKVDLLSREVEHPAVRELKTYVDQLENVFKAILSEQQNVSKPRARRKTTESGAV
ncbi:hypothetical protein [Alicyclobacillus dauci]|uniref:Uncharacterized protein n=1 Tax=Alicyclobacillus dauci TaxID=1475485 RepID=A0ABY6Z5V0_9BACL|nr:hypothetical protein [Alicyclobacillus dauci]WAH38262.1 hypothetical protein NZD86_07205 [Alicyclobacillus dauci]